MKFCRWNSNGKCGQIINMLKECRESNYKFFEVDNSEKQVNSGYLGKC